MAAVVGVMAIGLLLTSMIMVSIVGGLGYTSGTRAGVQSKAAADGGIAIARAGLESGTCAARGGVYQSAVGAVPQYRVEVWRPAGSGWVRGCPTSGTQVRLVSTGTAAASGVGVSGNDTSFVEAILAQPSVTPISTSGASVYAYESSGFSNSFSLDAAPGVGARPTVHVKQGNMSCSNSVSGEADWVIDNGTLSISNDCQIRGSAWSSGRTTLSNEGRIAGDLVAGGVSISNDGRVGGSVWSTGSVSLTGEVWGNVTGSSLSMQNDGRILRDAWINGSATLSNDARVQQTLTARSVSFSNRSSAGRRNVVPAGPGQSPFPAPIEPSVAEWTDFDYDPADWPGFQVEVISGNCGFNSGNGNDELKKAVARIAGRPGVVDARGCTGGVVLQSSQRLTTQNDLVIVANRFQLSNSAGISGVGRLWMIIPDSVDNDLPTCPPGGSFSMSNSASITNPLMIYSPCRVSTSNSVRMSGQLYAGSTSFSNSVTMSYVPMGLPNVDLSTGAQTPPMPARAVWPPISIRNLASNG